VAVAAERHFEKVSPADKGRGDIVGDGATNLASPSGDAVTLSTRTPFGDTIGSGVSGQTQYVARRTAGGWLSHAITPQPRADAYQTFFGATRFEAYSEDLRTGVLFGYDLPGATGDLPFRNNVYVEDLATRDLEVVTALRDGLPDPLPHPIAELGVDANWGVSADARHLGFVSPSAYLAQAAPGVPNVYQWDDGVLSLAGILPNGEVPTGGSDVGIPMYRASMSRDGSRLLFIAFDQGNPPQLYQRIDGNRTVWVSEPEVDPDDPNLPPNYQEFPTGVTLKAASPDGHTVLFTTDAALRADDTNGTTDLYRWTDSPDPSSDQNLTVISPAGNFDGEVIGLSDDGDRIYYRTTGDQVVVWDHGTTIVISEKVGVAPNPADGLGVEASEPGLGRVSPDGRYLALATRTNFFSPEGEIVGPTGEVTNAHRELYFYELGGEFKCISCPSGPAKADITVTPDVARGVISVKIPAIRPRFLSDDGEVFFSTPETLVAEDVNGVADAYQYDPATDSLSLVSSGTGRDPANFVDASASGDDVFFVTRQRLVGSDRDDLVDLYDARIGDAVPDPVERVVPVCEGEACQGAPSGDPGGDLPGSLVFEGAGAGALRVSGLRVPSRLTLRGVVGSLRVRVSGAGTLRLRGRGLRARSVKRTRAGTVVLRLRLGGRARTRLRASGRYRTSVRLTFVSPGGTVHRTTRVTFRAANNKGR
jgi:hypothetical protein